MKTMDQTTSAERSSKAAHTVAQGDTGTALEEDQARDQAAIILATLDTVTTEVGQPRSLSRS